MKKKKPGDNCKQKHKFQNLSDAIKALLKENFIAIKFDLKKLEKSKINNLKLNLKELQKQENPKLAQ